MKKIFLFLILLLFLGCSVKPYIKEPSDLPIIVGIEQRSITPEIGEADVTLYSITLRTTTLTMHRKLTIKILGELPEWAKIGNTVTLTEYKE